MNKQIFLVGHIIKETEDGTIWDVLGAFETAAEAEAACYDERCFVGPLTLEEVLPTEIIEWPGAYYPQKEGQSA